MSTFTLFGDQDNSGRAMHVFMNVFRKKENKICLTRLTPLTFQETWEEASTWRLEEGWLWKHR